MNKEIKKYNLKQKQFYKITALFGVLNSVTASLSRADLDFRGIGRKKFKGPKIYIKISF